MTSNLVAGLQEALDQGGNTHTLADVSRAVEAGEARFWEQGNAAIITEIHQFPRAKVIHFWLATGELEDVIALSERILAWAKQQGFTGATLAGRRGWTRVLANRGWEPRLVEMGRRL
jgi:hypothetical protein